MPLDIATGAPDPIGLADLVAWLDGPDFDPHDDAGLAAAAPMLAALGGNRDFLTEIAVAELKTRCRAQLDGNRYGPQVLMLHRTARYIIRANLWPAAGDPVVRTSGVAPFFYGVAHDHNFSFLTHGHHGPGYWSDYWTADLDADGAPTGLTPAGRSSLWAGRTMLYRAGLDVHRQLPADRLSVSLNIIPASPFAVWRDQHRFDPDSGRVTGLLGASATEALLAVSAHLGDGNGLDLVHEFAARHPCARVRRSARTHLDAAVSPERSVRQPIRAAGAGRPVGNG